MTSYAEEHALTSRELFAKAEEALVQGDLLQASEKGWGAAAHMVKGVAQKKGWRHDGHRELYHAVDQLAQETGDREIYTLFGVVIALDINSHEDWMPREFVEDGLESVMKFVQKLEYLL